MTFKCLRSIELSCNGLLLEYLRRFIAAHINKILSWIIFKPKYRIKRLMQNHDSSPSFSHCKVSFSNVHLLICVCIALFLLSLLWQKYSHVCISNDYVSLFLIRFNASTFVPISIFSLWNIRWSDLYSIHHNRHNEFD